MILNFKNIRSAAVAGQFYPDQAAEISNLLDDYFDRAKLIVTISPPIIIVPHAGYVYSGPVAAYGFKAIQGAVFKRAVLLGQSHQAFFNGAVVDGSEVWQTPAGSLNVDQEFVQQLLLTEAVRLDSQPHRSEHSLEVQIPFLIKSLGPEIKIVPILIGDDSLSTIQKLVQALKENIDSATLIIISTDLSHYPKYDDAQRIDQLTIEAILTGKPDRFELKIAQAESVKTLQTKTLICAHSAVAVGLSLAESLGLTPQLLKYANSGDYFPTTKNRVVGYAAIGFFKEAEPSSSGTADGRQQNGELKLEEQKIALTIARATLASAWQNQEYQLPLNLPAIFQSPLGVFVTLKKEGKLRGCIGNFMAEESLAQNIKNMAQSAAFGDPRFEALIASELDEVKIEISVLSPMRKISEPADIEVGRHGVYIKKGRKNGVYLPQVATEVGWDREQLLDSLCEEKAGLPKECWREGTADLYIFTAQVFGEY